MELEHTTVKELKLLDSAVREQPVEADLSLPEYYPAVGRILKCFICPYEEAVSCAEGRVSVAGAASVRLLYADDESKLHSFLSEVKYTRILPTDVREEQTVVQVSQDVSTMNCRAVGPRRVEIRATIAVKAELFGFLRTEVVSSAGERIQLRTEQMDYSEPLCVCCRDIVENTSVRCEAGGRRLRTVIAASSVPVLDKTEAAANKVMIRGKNIINVICVDDQGQPGSYELSVPFSEVLSCQGISEDSSVSVMFFRCEAEAALPDEADNKFDVTVRNKVFLLAAARKDLSFASDAYSLLGDADCGFAELTPARSFAVTEEEERVSTGWEAFEDSAAVRQVFTGDLLWAAEASGRRIDGTFCFYALVADSENRLSLQMHSVSFSHAVPDGCRCVCCSVSTKNETGEIRPGGTIDVSCVIVFRLLTQSGERERMLTEVKVEETPGTARRENVVVYFAEKGETLWEIAKANRTSVERIKTFNALSSETLESEAKLVFPSC